MTCQNLSVGIETLVAKLDYTDVDTLSNIALKNLLGIELLYHERVEEAEQPQPAPAGQSSEPAAPLVNRKGTGKSSGDAILETQTGFKSLQSRKSTLQRQDTTAQRGPADVLGAGA